MTYPRFARLFYVCLPIIFLGGAITLDTFGQFKYVGLLIIFIFALGLGARSWLSCPVCDKWVASPRVGPIGLGLVQYVGTVAQISRTARYRSSDDRKHRS